MTDWLSVVRSLFSSFFFFWKFGLVCTLCMNTAQFQFSLKYDLVILSVYFMSGNFVPTAEVWVNTPQQLDILFKKFSS